MATDREMSHPSEMNSPEVEADLRQPQGVYDENGDRLTLDENGNIVGLTFTQMAEALIELGEREWRERNANGKTD